MEHYYFPRIVQDMGGAGRELTTLEATEGSAGNISVCVRELRNLDEAFSERGRVELPVVVPALGGMWVIVTGTGRRLRDVGNAPKHNLVVMHIQPDGSHATWYTADDVRPTSEWNSHLAVHNEQIGRRDLDYHAIVHAQPHYLTFLSHHPNYATTAHLSRRLLRWEPETILTFPEGIGLIPFQVPGSVRLMQDTAMYLATYRLVIWQKHGVFARSDVSAARAADLVEYAEMAARYEMLNLQLGDPSSGLSGEELRAVCAAFNVPFQRF